MKKFLFTFRYYGFWFKHDVSDVGDIRYYTYRNNMILEMSMAGNYFPPKFQLIKIAILKAAREQHPKDLCRSFKVSNSSPECLMVCPKFRNFPAIYFKMSFGSTIAILLTRVFTYKQSCLPELSTLSTRIIIFTFPKKN